jgi:signal transduction histidine kinase
MRSSFAPRYLLACVLLLTVLVTLLAVSAARRTHQELTRQLEDMGLALASTLEASSQSAIRGNALMEEMIGQRLLDNARLLDQLLLFRPPDPDWLGSIRAANRLLRIDLLDREGRPYAWPARPAPMGMMGMMMGHPPTSASPPASGSVADGHRSMMMLYMWGRRWGQAVPEPSTPASVRDRKFWEGSVFGVAVTARSFPGIIAIHADADYVLNFSKEIGVQREVEELGRRAGIESVAILDGDLVAVAHSDPARLGQRETDVGLRQLLAQGGTRTRFTPVDGAPSRLEVTRPFALGTARPGLLQVQLSIAPMEQVWRRDRLAAMLMGSVVLGLGILGLAAIFYTQHRRLAQVTALEAEVARRERLATLGNMVATVSHEVRNPLNAISMGLQRLRAEFHPTAEPDEYQRLLDLVTGEVRRLNTLVDESLALARAPRLQPEPVQVGDLLDEAVGLIEAEAHRIGVRIERHVPTDLPPVAADRSQLTQVLLNLARNALEAMPDGGTLRMEAAATPRALTLDVTDSGRGIPREIRPRLFEPYYTTKVTGLGLGLALARQIVEAHGGTIEFEPTAEGGSRFRITLPLPGAAS